MTREEIISFVWSAIAIFGTSGAIAAAVSGFISKYLADRSLETHRAELGRETERLKSELGKEIETHKWELKRRELLFGKQLDAAGDFFELHRKLQPQFRHPDMDWSEAVEDVLTSFSDSEDKLAKFIAKHGPVLSSENRQDLDACKETASNYQFELHQSRYSDKEAEKAVERFLEGLRKVEERFVKETNS